VLHIIEKTKQSQFSAFSVENQRSPSKTNPNYPACPQGVNPVKKMKMQNKAKLRKIVTPNPFMGEGSAENNCRRRSEYMSSTKQSHFFSVAPCRRSAIASATADASLWQEMQNKAKYPHFHPKNTGFIKNKPKIERSEILHSFSAGGQSQS
jgi:hypothetical protein